MRRTGGTPVPAATERLWVAQRESMSPADLSPQCALSDTVADQVFRTGTTGTMRSTAVHLALHQ